jgi:hypothetical protein
MTGDLRDDRERGWFHLDNEVVDTYLPLVGHTTFALYVYIVRSVNRDRGYAWPSYTKMQRALGIGRNQVATAIKTLVGHGLMRVEKGGPAAVNHYYITTPGSLAQKLVSVENQSRSETKTSLAEKPHLVSERDSIKTELKRQSDKERERERTPPGGLNLRAPPRPLKVGNLIPLPDPFVNDSPEIEAWVRERKMPFDWVNNRTDSFVAHFRESGTMLSPERWQERFKKWLLDDWAKERNSGLLTRR